MFSISSQLCGIYAGACAQPAKTSRRLCYQSRSVGKLPWLREASPEQTVRPVLPGVGFCIWPWLIGKEAVPKPARRTFAGLSLQAGPTARFTGSHTKEKCRPLVQKIVKNVETPQSIKPSTGLFWKHRIPVSLHRVHSPETSPTCARIWETGGSSSFGRTRLNGYVPVLQRVIIFILTRIILNDTTPMPIFSYKNINCSRQGLQFP